MGEGASTATPLAAWLVRGGEHGEREALALTEGLAIAGWPELGDLSGCDTRDAIRDAVREAYPEVAENVIANWTGQLWRFARQISSGDYVVMPLHTQPGQVAIGHVTGAYEFRADEPEGFRQIRRVEWLQKELPREAFRPDLRASITSLLTVCGLTRYDAAMRVAHLAEYGSDPGMDGAEEITSAEELLEDAASRGASDPRRLTIRSFLEHWEHTRRIGSVEKEIKSDLADKGLTTRPSFMDGSLDDEIEIVPARVEPDASSMAEPEDDDGGSPQRGPSTYQISSLPPSKVVSVPPGSSLELVQTVMLNKKFSQLAVINEDGRFHGAVSWESIGRSRVGHAHPTLEQAMVHPVLVDHHALLLDQIDVIYEKGYVFVQDEDGSKVTGIVTAADLTRKFGDQARPFMLIEEIESRLCLREDHVFTLDELKAAAPRNRRDKIERAADFTMGTHAYLLEPAGHWARLGWNIDHQYFLEKLKTVTDIRNDLMHYSPDPVPDGAYEEIEGLLEILRTVDPTP